MMERLSSLGVKNVYRVAHWNCNYTEVSFFQSVLYWRFHCNRNENLRLRNGIFVTIFSVSVTACSKDNQVVVWDIRKANGPLMRLDQHNGGGASSNITGGCGFS